MAGSNGTTRALNPSRPTFTVGGRDEAALSARLTRLTIAEAEHGLYRCEARFGNWGSRGQGPDYLYFDRRLLDFGKELAVFLGAGDGEAEVFRGRISGLEAEYGRASAPSIVALAEDRAQDLRMTRRTRAFEDATDADIFRQIAAEHGLQASIDAPRWRWEQGRDVALEPHVPDEVAAGLEARGHRVIREGYNGAFGRGQIIWRLPDGGYMAGSESRADGTAVGY